MKSLFFILVLVLVFVFTVANAQDATPPSKDYHQELEQRLEILGENTDNSNADYTTLIDALSYYQEHPLNLNYATQNELKSLGLLSDLQINALLDHIEKNGTLITLYELQSIANFDLITIEKILPYVKVDDTFFKPHLNFEEIKKNGINTIILRESRTLEKQKGFDAITDSALASNPNSRYLGSADNLYVRYKFNYSTNISVGLTAEKDAGESFLKTPRNTGDTLTDQLLKTKSKKGFDFFSAHIYLRNIGKFKQVAIGDYQVSIGQGAVFSNGLAFGKNADPLTLKRNFTGIKPYSSVNPAVFLRGMALAYQFKKVELLGFVSNKKLDGNITISDTAQLELNASTSENVNISSVQLSGFHRTPSELENKNTLTEQLAGGRISYNSRHFILGFTNVLTQFNGNFEPAVKPYAIYSFSGSRNVNTGIDYSLLWKNFNFYGEAGRSLNGGLALVCGVMASLDPRVNLVIHYRNFAKNYQALNANAISENTTKQNERGLYTGFSFKPNLLFSLNAYFDRFSFPWLKYQVNSPTQGNDFFAQVNYTPNRKSLFYVRYRHRTNYKNSGQDTEEIDYVIATQQANYRIEGTYPVSPSITLKHRVEMAENNTELTAKEKGYLVFTDVAYKQLSSPVQIAIRYSLFNSPNYTTRIYAYEKDVLYAYSIPALYHSGQRAYLLLRYTPIKNTDIWVRIGSTIYYNQTTIGSGLSEIHGNHKTDVKIQLRIKF